METDSMVKTPTAARLTRRQVLRRTGLVALGIGLAPLLQGCAAGAATGHVVEMNDQLKFVPDKLFIKVGDTVTWKNSGTLVHTVTDDPAKAQNRADVKLPPGAQPFDSGDIPGGQSWSRKFDVAGEYVYFCIPHELAGMVASLTVTP